MLLASLLALNINQLSEICGTDEPGRFLTAQPECAARQLLRGRSAPGFGAAKSEILRSNAVKRNVCLAEFGKQPEICAVHNNGLQSSGNTWHAAPTIRKVEEVV